MGLFDSSLRLPSTHVTASIIHAPSFCHSEADADTDTERSEVEGEADAEEPMHFASHYVAVSRPKTLSFCHSERANE